MIQHDSLMYNLVSVSMVKRELHSPGPIEVDRYMLNQWQRDSFPGDLDEIIGNNEASGETFLKYSFLVAYLGLHATIPSDDHPDGLKLREYCSLDDCEYALSYLTSLDLFDSPKVRDCYE